MKFDITATFFCSGLIMHLGNAQTEQLLKKDQIGPYNVLGSTLRGEWVEYASRTVKDGNVYEKVTLRFDLGVGKLGWGAGTWVQTYVSFEDIANRGIFSSFTCNTEFNFNQDYSQTKIVESFQGEVPLTYTREETGKWSDIAEEDKLYEDEEIWMPVYGDEETDYKSTFENSKSWQYCTAEATLYEAINGMAPSEAIEGRNNFFLAALENNVVFDVYTGWRTWTKWSGKYEEVPSDGANSSTFKLRYQAWEQA